MAQNKPRGLFGSLFQSKAARKQQAIQDMQKLQQEMLQEEETMRRCVQESLGLDPNSVQYRINERKYEDAEKMLQLKKKAFQSALDMLSEIERKKAIFGSLFQSKAAREQQAIQDMQKLQQEMLKEEETMQRCVLESRGLAPDSVQYRINARKYEDAEKMLQLKKKAFKSALDMLSEVERQKAIVAYKESQQRLLDKMNMLFGPTVQLTWCVDEDNYVTEVIDNQQLPWRVREALPWDIINVDAILGQEFAPAAEPKDEFLSLVRQTDSGNQ